MKLSSIYLIADALAALAGTATAAPMDPTHHISGVIQPGLEHNQPVHRQVAQVVTPGALRRSDAVRKVGDKRPAARVPPSHIKARPGYQLDHLNVAVMAATGAERKFEAAESAFRAGMMNLKATHMKDGHELESLSRKHITASLSPEKTCLHGKVGQHTGYIQWKTKQAEGTIAALHELV